MGLENVGISHSGRIPDVKLLKDFPAFAYLHALISRIVRTEIICMTQLMNMKLTYFILKIK